MRARIVLIFATLVAAAGCGSESQGAGSRETVVAAFYPIAYAAERVAPEADVRNLTPAGAEPHDLELSPRDVERVRDADAVLYFGRGFMPALEDAAAGEANAVELLAAVELRGDDPHVWLDPQRYAVIVREIADAIAEPSDANALVRELGRLDGEFRRGLANCVRRDLVTSHAAFGYLAAAYGLDQIPLTGLSPETEPTARAIEDLVAEVERSGATTVFFETLVSPELAQTVAREAGVSTAVLDPLEGLTEDGADQGEDYFSVMRANLAALRKALECR